MDRCRLRTIAYVLLVSICLSACGQAEAPVIQESQDTGFIVTKAGMYDSADHTAVLISKDAQDKTVTFFNRDTERRYTLYYDGTSKIYDKYGTAMSMEQVKNGCIVDITFLKNKRLLNSMTMSADSWQYEKINDYVIDDQKKELIINGSNYKYDENLFVYTDGSRGEIMDINPVDAITVAGVDRKVCSISLEEGHGYIRLKNEDYFVGGWIEIGSKIIKTIGEDMLIAVPIGTYDVKLSKDGIDGVKTVTIARNQESLLDLSDLKVEEIDKKGNLIMVVNPPTAEVYVDGEEVDITAPVKLDFGIHQVIARAEGFQTLTQYIKVGQENATLEFTLEKEIVPITPTPGITPVPTAVPEPVAPNPAPVPTTGVANSNVATTVNGYKVTIQAPAEAEVYVDGNYTGISPVSFSKVSGNHEITLRKDGYVTRSYTISLDSSERDETFSFSDLEKYE